MIGVLEPRAGILFPERCIETQTMMAASSGAELHFDEPISSWTQDDLGVSVTTHRGEYRARRMIVASGAWIADLVPSLACHFAVERQTLFWFSAKSAPQSFAPERCPVHLWQFERGEFFYGFPDMGDGIKVARHHAGIVTISSPTARRAATCRCSDRERRRLGRPQSPAERDHSGALSSASQPRVSA